MLTKRERARKDISPSLVVQQRTGHSPPASEAPTETWRTDGVRAKWSNLKEWLAVLHDLEQRRDSVPRKNKLRAHYDALDKQLEAALDQSTLVEVHEAWRVLSSTTRDDGGYSPRSEQRARILDALDRRCAQRALAEHGHRRITIGEPAPGDCLGADLEM